VYTGSNENKSTFMKSIERFILVAMICTTLILCSGLIAYAIALPRFQVINRDDGDFVINDSFTGEIFLCGVAESDYGCLLLNPQEAELLSLNK